eukprot:3791943-Alexandrium_andersonii.AAC.1
MLRTALPFPPRLVRRYWHVLLQLCRMIWAPCVLLALASDVSGLPGAVGASDAVRVRLLVYLREAPGDLAWHA